jgi:DNA-binding response OmpR family regulator
MARSDRMKVVAFSAEDDTVTRQAMQDAGAASYLTKNVPPHELRATILTLMERKC